MPTTACPECSEDVYVDAESEQGDIISCDECGSELEIVGLDPIELDIYTDVDLDVFEDEEEDRLQPKNLFQIDDSRSDFINFVGIQLKA